MELETTMKVRGKVCECYVRHLPVIEQYSLRYGAHALDCPIYRQSCDPVDDLHDREFRDRMTKLVEA